MASLSIQARKIARGYVKSLKPWLRVEKALLFGSAARGKMTKHSDIDLIVLSKDFQKMRLDKRLVMLSRLRGYEYSAWPMDILGYTPSEFEQLAKLSDMFAEAKKDGIEIK